MTFRLLALAAAGLLACACTQGGKVYPSPIAQARATLLATGLPPMVFGTNEPPFDVLDEGSDIAWVIRLDDGGQAGGELFRYIAYLKEEGPAATRVRVELKGVQTGPTGNVQQSLDAHPQIRDMYLAAVKERIASALEHREFSMTGLYPQMGLAVLSNMGNLVASADAAAAASNKADRDNIEKAYADEAAGRR